MPPRPEPMRRRSASTCTGCRPTPFGPTTRSRGWRGLQRDAAGQDQTSGPDHARSGRRDHRGLGRLGRLLGVSGDAELDYAYLTTTGRVTGRPHEIEIWFALHAGTVYVLSGGGDRSDWV